MLNKQRMGILAIAILGFILVGQSAIAGGIAFGIALKGGRVESQVVYSSRPGDKLTSEKRDGEKMADWIERGASSVTDSPKYRKGIRLATWATQDKDEYDYGLASAVYSFQIPGRAHSMKIKIHYDGEPGRYSTDNDTAGRVWIRSKYPVDRYETRYSDETRDSDQPLYGDTFILLKKKHDAEIIISSRDHVINGIMELHVIAEGGQRLDVDYVKVETYTYLPAVRVVTREYRNYVPRPWYHQTYFYFYTGPVYHFSGDYYLTYNYPRNHNMIEIRGRYGNYLREYHVRHPQIQLYWSGKLNFPKIAINAGRHDIRINRWTPEYEKTRKTYVKDYKRTGGPADVRTLRNQIQNAIAEHRKSSDDQRKNSKRDDDDRDYRRSRDRGR